MKALIYKDFIAIKKPILILAALIILIGIYNFNEENFIAMPLMFILIPLIFIGMLFGNDAESHSDQYIAAGPVKKETIVLSRYVPIWCLAFIGTAFAFIIRFIPQADAYILPWYVLLPAMLFLTTVISDIQLPFMYKFGAEKSRLVFVALYFVVFAVFSYFGSNKDLLTNWPSVFSSVNIKLAGCILFALTVIINLLSFVCSVRIYKKKEF